MKGRKMWMESFKEFFEKYVPHGVFLIGAFLVGSMFGSSAQRMYWTDAAIEQGFAKYEEKTGNWRWKTWTEISEELEDVK